MFVPMLSKSDRKRWKDLYLHVMTDLFLAKTASHCILWPCGSRVKQFSSIFFETHLSVMRCDVILTIKNKYSTSKINNSNLSVQNYTKTEDNKLTNKTLSDQ